MITGPIAQMQKLAREWAGDWWLAEPKPFNPGHWMAELAVRDWQAQQRRAGRYGGAILPHDAVQIGSRFFHRTPEGKFLLIGKHANLTARQRTYYEGRAECEWFEGLGPIPALAGGIGQGYAGVLSPPPIANLTAVTATTETILWNVTNYTPILAGDCQAAKIYRVTAGGIMSFASTGTLIITPRFGLTVAAGITMGANVVAVTTPGVTTAHPWLLDFICVGRTVGAPGVNSTVIGTGRFSTGTPGAAGAAVVLSIGGTSATVDVSIATGICIGWTLSVAGTVTPQFAFIQSLN